MKRSEAGLARLAAIGLLLLGLGAAGAWNYQRNLAAESAEPRPYRSLSEADLAALAEAYQEEIETFTARYEAASGRKVQVVDGRLLGDQIREFERVQAISESTRRIGRALSEREGALRRVKQEQARREDERDRLRLFLRRVLTI